ncbi:hypothetical protein CO051_03865 [Candidatus Roizmanbacteria bacterium CG_4_9_14_0_2_um_filter_39_13]|uniref:PIN domain-containing protein n=1 Tax=Candidatus Roizmanbacteria bacterium CG_4_9_14_0_2_um_filter_39_13 TaxID=1974839 RepID=A0A2M8EYN5_9BACT|nr:MAG: hypothetical protein CO051_03865 [Candidatus Roizmanbacteria bacterium CG_4_9_14_0_2_um_filter_39_13]
MTTQYHHLADIKDVPILTATIEYDCTYFITGNMKDFMTDQIAKEHQITIVSPADFLKYFEVI